jgi:hypothetical protein
MSRRTKIIDAIVTKLKDIDGTGSFNSNLFTNVYPKLIFWDQIRDFPSVCAVSGAETREYHPSDFTWGYLGVSLKVYTKGENATADLEELLEDIENVINDNRALQYDTSRFTTEILVTSIVTDEGLLSPYAVGEMNLQVRFACT